VDNGHPIDVALVDVVVVDFDIDMLSAVLA
jgi:hypothetical protein